MPLRLSGARPFPFMSACLITPRQASILNLLTEGKSNKQIAQSLNCAERTIKEHIRQLCWKLQVKERKRTTLARYWLCPIFRLGAGYETPLTAAADVLERDRLRAKEANFAHNNSD